jgi:hypothetical protein
MIVTLLIASLAVVLRFIRQTARQRSGHHPVSKVTKILDSLPAGSPDSRRLLAWTNFTSFFISNSFPRSWVR